MPPRTRKSAARRHEDPDAEYQASTSIVLPHQEPRGGRELRQRLSTTSYASQTGESSDSGQHDGNLAERGARIAESPAIRPADEPPGTSGSGSLGASSSRFFATPSDAGNEFAIAANGRHGDVQSLVQDADEERGLRVSSPSHTPQRRPPGDRYRTASDLDLTPTNMVDLRSDLASPAPLGHIPGYYLNSSTPGSAEGSLANRMENEDMHPVGFRRPMRLNGTWVCIALAIAIIATVLGGLLCSDLSLPNPAP